MPGEAWEYQHHSSSALVFVNHSEVDPEADDNGSNDDSSDEHETAVATSAASFTETAEGATLAKAT